MKVKCVDCEECFDEDDLVINLVRAREIDDVEREERCPFCGSTHIMDLEQLSVEAII